MTTQYQKIMRAVYRKESNMNGSSISPELKNFVGKTIMMGIGLLLISGIIALSLDLSFGMILFVLGGVFTVIGGYLGGPNRYYPKNPRTSPEELTAFKMHSIKNSVPFYAFENVLLFAGLIAIIISLLLLF